MSVLDHGIISQRYFFPRPSPQPRHPHRVAYRGGELVCSRQSFDERWPWMVLFHGNGEVAADYEGEFSNKIRKLGLNLLIGTYRGYGGSGGDPKLAAMLGDVAPIIEATGADPSRVVLFGRSVGSIYAIHGAAERPEIAGLVLESGIASPLQRVLLRVEPHELGTTAEVIARHADRHLNHQEKLGAYTHPLLILHATHDSLVTIDHAQQNLAWSASPDKQLVAFDRGDHNSIQHANQAAYFEHLGAFTRALFGTS